MQPSPAPVPGRSAAPAAAAAAAGSPAPFFLDLAFKAAWIPLFFRARQPRLALAEIACLDLANVVLIRRAWRADRAAAALLVPYAAWTAFATALNAEIARLNPAPEPPVS